MENGNLEIVLSVLSEKIKNLIINIECQNYEITKLKEKIKELEEKKEDE